MSFVGCDNWLHDYWYVSVNEQVFWNTVEHFICSVSLFITHNLWYIVFAPNNCQLVSNVYSAFRWLEGMGHKMRRIWPLCYSAPDMRTRLMLFVAHRKSIHMTSTWFKLWISLRDWRCEVLRSARQLLHHTLATRETSFVGVIFELWRSWFLFLSAIRIAELVVQRLIWKISAVLYIPRQWTRESTLQFCLRSLHETPECTT